MFKNKGIILIVVVFNCFFTAIKSQPAIDTINYSIKQKPVLFGKFGTRDSFIDNNRAGVLGVQLGINFANRFRLGVGYNQLYSSSAFFDKQLFFLNYSNITVSTNAHLQLAYFSAFVEYVYYRNHRWQFSIPLQLGIGQIYYKYLLNNETKKMDQSSVFVYEPATSVEYKVVKWLGLGADIGFRFILTDYKKHSEKLNSPTYAFKLLIYYSEIYKSIKKKKEDWK